MHDTFDPNASGLNRALAKGHLIRLGHVLVGHYEEQSPNSGIYFLVRDCCKQ